MAFDAPDCAAARRDPAEEIAIAVTTTRIEPKKRFRILKTPSSLECLSRLTPPHTYS